ncbi:MAG: GNAT family N-acetyltransferase [Chloroflexota bacterium]|nr:GNAT family N-acetyltransferase [Chloroflexota bacterium]
MSNAIEVIHNPAESRFEVQLDGDIAMVEYMLHGSNISFTHTEVPAAHEGKGIANQMAQVALNYARDNSLRVNAVCPFIKLYIQRHPEYQAITWGY